MTDAAGQRLIVGTMTGTSLDGLDAALVVVTGRGLSMRARVVEFAEAPFMSLAPRLRDVADQKPCSAEMIARLALDFGLLHADAIERLLGGRRADLIVLHGQTVFHGPPASWQMINPWPVAARHRTTVVSDLRGADLAAGGQGAPITPLADWILFKGERARTIINLGGFCNMTLLPGVEAGSPSGTRGMDVCACNHVLNLAARRGLGMEFDRDGAAALRGTISEAASTALVSLLGGQSAEGRSLGTGDEAARWVEAWIGLLSADDLCASACDGVARSIARAVPSSSEVVLAGGGARNPSLVRALTRHITRECRTTDDLNVPIAAREAACMAVLGALAQDGVPITLNRVTGRGDRCPPAGCWIHA